MLTLNALLGAGWMRLERKGQGDEGDEYFAHGQQVSSYTELLMPCTLLSRKMGIIALPQWRKWAFAFQAHTLLGNTQLC